MLHGAYSFSPAFDAGLVTRAFDRLALGQRATILDPFCGTGTTLLESKLSGLRSVGVDANPVCVLVSKAKTNWSLDIAGSQQTAALVGASAVREYRTYLRRLEDVQTSRVRATALADAMISRTPPGRYLLTSGLIERGWISRRPALKTLLIAERLWVLEEPVRSFLLLGLLGLMVPDISNMAFGPEIYRARHRRDRDVFGLFQKRVRDNLQKLGALKNLGPSPRALVRLGDSTNHGLSFLEDRGVDAVVTSPPYLSDHDYSRLTRLELVFSGQVASTGDLRRLKRRLLRSSSKNVYKDDHATGLVKRFPSVKKVIDEISERASQRSSGFARVYPRLVGEYFGDMYRHFQALGRVLRPGGQAAYIVSDQSSFFALRIQCTAIVAELAEKCGAALRVIDQEAVRKYHGTRGAVSWSNQESMLLLQKKGRRNGGTTSHKLLRP
jgi:tRNA G10  N-methylase Trm11